MPVAVDRTPDMGASNDKGNTGDPLPPDATRADKTKKLRPHRIPKKSREVLEEQPVAGSSTEHAHEDGSTWSWRSLTESSASKVKPVFTKDGSYFMTASGVNVKIYSVASGQVVSTLSPANTSSQPAAKTGYGDAVTSMALSPHNAFQLFTASLDGCIRVWDFVDAVLLQTIDLGLPILHLAAHEKFKNEVCVALSKKTKKLNVNKNPTKEDNAVVMRVSLIPTNATARLPVQQPSETRHVGKARAPSALAFSPSGSWLVAIGAHKAYVARTTNLQSGFTKLISPDKLTCLAFHPTEEYFATGDTRGLVRLWYCLNDNIPSGVSGVEKKAPTTTLHWHAHPVASIAFTANGAYLLSGGDEAVLVIWQLHTGRKEFVPRVGAPISTVTLSTSNSNEEEYLLGLADASFVFVRSGTLRLGKTIARVKLDPAISHDRSSTSSRVPLAAHGISSTLILPSSHPSTLQLYSPTTSKLLSELEVSPSNRISRRDEKALEPCRVEVSAISDSGEWLATLDTREGDHSFRGEVYLKLWSWDRKAGQWTLNTRIDRPHGLAKVTAISFRPRTRDDASLLLTTTGEDGQIKVWGVRTSTTKAGGTENYWVARSTVRYRSEIPTHASWAQDGSLLAVSLGPYVVLYDPSTMLVLKTLSCPECSAIASTHFIGRSGRYIAIKGQRDLVLWDLVMDSVKWHYRSSTAITHLFSHPREDTFVVFEADVKSPRPKTYVLKFTPSASSPASSYFLPFRLQNIAACPSKWLMSNESSSFAFVGVTQDWNAVIFGDQIHLAESDPSEGKGLVGPAPVTKQTLFQDIFGKSAFADISSSKYNASAAVSSTTVPWKGKQVEESFRTPAYLMPPLSTLFDPLMDEFLKLRPPEEDGPGGDDKVEEEDVEMMEEEGGGDAPIVVGNRLERIVDDAEMVSMIELFKSHCLLRIPAPVTTAPTTPKVNGYHKYAPKVNGVAATTTPTVNGATIPTPKALPTKTAEIVSADLVPEPASSPVKAGQKRKKSVG
ncbi:WD40 repeat-like protein [Cytidiella melzeri]|nr:WD40 repeat-like protein [Cytidiella melzeri]